MASAAFRMSATLVVSTVHANGKSVAAQAAMWSLYP